MVTYGLHGFPPVPVASQFLLKDTVLKQQLRFL